LPERWQDELRKLRREEMPDGVRERAEGGPRRDLPNDGRQRLVAGIVAFAVFIAAGAFAWRAFGGTSTSGTEPTSPSIVTIVLELDGRDGDPAATLSAGSVSQDGVREGYHWCGSDGECVGAQPDYGNYPPVSQYLPVAPGSPIESTGDGHLTRLVIRTTKGDSSSPNVLADTDGTGVVVPPDPGRYVIWISASWGESGSAAFDFGVEVLPPPEEAPGLLHLTCTPDSATLDSGVVRAQADGVHIAIDASDDVNHAEIFTGSTPETYGGFGADERSDGSEGMSIAPGDWHIGCRTVGPSDVGSGAVAAFTVVDPDGHYLDTTLPCDQPVSVDLAARGDDVVSATRLAIPGVLPTDGFVRAGYDGDQFKTGELFVVTRDGSTIADVTIGYGAKVVWSFTVESCAGSGVGADAAVEIDPTAAP
jgi:hypothetical protein